MKRRDFFKKAGVGSAALVSASALPIGNQNAAAQQDDEHGHGELMSGPHAHAVVSFGQWRSDFNPPLDRLNNAPPAPPTNNHQLLPFEVTIKKGGAVTFLISGLHQVIVYDNRTKPDDIPETMTVPTFGIPGLNLIDFATNRLYRGPDPTRLLPNLDRLETVHFPKRGRYLVICGVQPHFIQRMVGYVRVLP